MKIVFAIIVALLVSHNAMSQSDYGWFTGKASAFTCEGHEVGVSYHHFYNVADRMAAGMGLGVRSIKEHGGALLPITGAIKLGLTDRKPPVMPILQVSAGYGASRRDCRGLYVEERIGLETTKIARIRFSFDFGCAHIHDSKSCFVVAAGILF